MNNQELVTNTKLIAIYARVSTARQEEDGTIETQLGAVREFARQYGYTIIREYIDDGWSGDVLIRPSLDELRADAPKKVWQAVLMYDPDRLARRYSYQELVMDELREKGVEVMFVTIPAPKNSEEKILHGVRGLFAEYERAKITERFRLGKLRKVKEGHVLVSQAPYGYTYTPKQGDRHGFFEIDPVEARAVRLMFECIANEGLSIRQLVRRLQELSIRPRWSTRGVWSTSTLTTLLRNGAYIGEAHWGSSYAVVPENPIKKDKYRKTKKSSRRTKPVEEWLTIPVPAIIDKELFERARAQLKTNFALCQRNRKNEYLLASKIRCACGRTRSGEGPLRGKHLYYRCTDRVLSFPLPGTCKERGINARIADKLVWEKIVELMSSESLLLTQVDCWLKARQAKTMSAVGEISPIQREIAALKSQEDRYNKAYGAGLFTIDQLREYLMPIKDKVASLKHQITGLEQQNTVIDASELPSPNHIKHFTEAARKTLHHLNFQARRAIVLSTVEKVVGTQRQLTVYGYIPITDHVEFKTSDRHGQNTNRPDTAKQIPLEFTIELPSPRYERNIVSRDHLGRIIYSKPPDDVFSDSGHFL